MNKVNKHLQPPVINLNGTSAVSIKDGYDKAHSKLNSALDALYRIAPHGRDYQTVSHAHFMLACEQHEARIIKVRDLMKEILDLYELVELTTDKEHVCTADPLNLSVCLRCKQPMKGD